MASSTLADHGDLPRQATSQSEGWQPIETAPKDGTSVLLFDGATVSYGGWLDAAAQGVDAYEAHLVSGGWWSVDLAENEPTHWMPLPPPRAD